MKRINGQAITATSFGFDGCHKFYLIESEEDLEMLTCYGYQIHPIEKLPSAWLDSCPLRFISHGDLSLPDVVTQFTPAWFSGWEVSDKLQAELDSLAEEQKSGGSDMSEWKGEGWYRIAFSDGGQDWTNEGPIWIENLMEFNNEMEAASGGSTDMHIPYAEYMGDGDEPKEEDMNESLFQMSELEALLGDFIGDFDVDGIIADATEVRDGKRYWTDVDGDELNVVLAKHEK